MDDYDDDSLLLKIGAGDQQAFKALMDKHIARYFQIAYRFLLSKHDAEDAVQEAWMRLWREAGKWQNNARRPLSFTAWFYRVVVNCCLDQLRRPKNVELNEDIANNLSEDKVYSASNTVLTPEWLAQQSETERRVKAALLVLPVRQRMAFTLFFYEGLSYQEAASFLGVSLKALESLIIRARQSLRSQLADLI